MMAGPQVDAIRARVAEFLTDTVALHRGEVGSVFDPNTGQESLTPPPLVWSGNGRVLRGRESDDINEQGWDVEENPQILLPWDADVQEGDLANFTTSQDPLLVGSWWEVRTIRRDSFTVRRIALLTPYQGDL